MGGKSSKSSSMRKNSLSSDSTTSSYGYGCPPPPTIPYPQYAPSPQHQFAPSPSTAPNYGYQATGCGVAANPQLKKRLERKYSRIADNYRSIDEVTAALAQAGLESSNLIVGIDFTKSNEWTGARSFHRKSLHHIGNGQNPYEQAISVIGKTLSAFDEDNLIPCFGFGDASTHDQDVFSFYNGETYCNGFEEVLSRYRELAPTLRLAGPTSFAPVIEMATTIVEQSGGQYHVLLIIADGQVTRSVDTPPGHLSLQEQQTIDAIVKASQYPLSIVLVGVGDGPWDMMKEFDDNIPSRVFDNFQFVNSTAILSKNVEASRKEAEFALAALMEIPSQYKATLELNILGRRAGQCPDRIPLPPPVAKPAVNSGSNFFNPNSYQRTEPAYPDFISKNTAASTQSAYSNATPAPSSVYDSQACPVCFGSKKDMAFGCGHQTCCDCGEDLTACPICRRAIETRIRLY